MKNDTKPKPFDRKEFANRLKSLLKAKGITQEEFANKLGAKRQTIGNYVTGERVPPVELAFEMAQILEVSTDYFLGLSTTQSTDTDIQTIHNKTGLSEEVISSLQREIKMIKRLTNIKNVDLALSEYLDFRKFSHFVSEYCGYDELAEYAEEHGFSNIDEILDYELNLTPIKLLQFVPDAIVLNELMRGSNSKYVNTELRTVKNALYDVLSYNAENKMYGIVDPDDQDYIYDHFVDIEKDIASDEEMNKVLDKYIAGELTDEEMEQLEAEPSPDPVIEELHKANALERNGLEDKDMFTFKLLRLQQALTQRLENIKNSKK